MSNNIMYDMADALMTDLRTKDGSVTGKPHKRRISLAKKHHVDFDIEVVGGTASDERSTVVLKVSSELHFILAGFRYSPGQSKMYYMAIKGSAANVEIMHNLIQKVETSEGMLKLIDDGMCTAAWETDWHDKGKEWGKIK